MTFNISNEFLDNIMGGKEKVPLKKVHNELSKKMDPNFYGRTVKRLDGIKFCGLSMIAATVITALIFTIIVAVATNGFGPTPNPNFYQTVIPLLATPSGCLLPVGVIATLVGAVAKHVHLKKKVDRTQVKGIVEEAVQNMDESIKNGDKLIDQLNSELQKLQDARKSVLDARKSILEQEDSE